MKELISICIPTYNGEKYLKECLDTVLSQSYENIEIIIVDDCSTDKTVEIISNIIKLDSRIKLFLLSKNLLRSSGFNKIILKLIDLSEMVKDFIVSTMISQRCL